ncbi:MAG: hypothetical protein COA95_00025 [Methylophaga sp.]|nr:MAG: hypothetical protein COA95_00025 [Methylophaga sp.]
MNYSEIHKALKDEGLTWVMVADSIGCNYSHVINVCARRTDSKKVAKSVALLIDKDICNVFPDKPDYQENKETKKAVIISDARTRLVAAGLVAA